MGIQKEKQNLSLRPFPPLSKKNRRFIFLNRGISKRINPQRKDRGIGIDPDPSIQPKDGKALLWLLKGQRRDRSCCRTSNCCRNQFPLFAINRFRIRVRFLISKTSAYNRSITSTLSDGFLSWLPTSVLVLRQLIFRGWSLDREERTSERVLFHSFSLRT